MNLWEWQPLGSVARTSSGGTPLKSKREYYENGQIPWLLSGEVGQRKIQQATHRITELGLASSSAKMFPKDTVLVAMYGATAGEVGTLDFPCSTNQAVCGIYPGDRLLPDFLYYYFLHVKDQLAGTATGNAQPNISQAKIRATEVPLPSLAEQRRIVAILDEAFAGIATATANAEQNLANAREMPGNLIDAILADEPSHRRLSMAEAAGRTCSLSYGIVQPGDESENGIPIVRPVDMRQEIIGLEGLKRINPEIASAYKRTQLQGDEILLCVRGTTGTVSLASYELAGCNVTRGIVPIRFDPALVSRKFGYYLIRSGAVQKQIRSATYGTGLLQINIGDLKKIVFDAPVLERQSVLNERLDRLLAELNALQDTYARKVAAFGQLKQSILRCAFSGEPLGIERLAA